MSSKFLITLAAVVGSAGAFAAPLDRDLLVCAAETDDARRLACYDKAVAAISSEAARTIAERRAATERLAAEQAAAAAAAAAKAKADAEVAKREAFGAQRPAASDADLDQLEAGVVETLTRGDKVIVFLLDNGQLWRQMETETLPPVRAGDKVVIKRGALGAFRLTLLRQRRTMDVKRMR